MKNSKALAVLGLGGVALLVLTGGKKASAASSNIITGGPGSYPGYSPETLPVYNPDALPDLVMANFPSGQQAPAPSPSPQQIQPQVNPYSIPVPNGSAAKPSVITTGETPIVAPAVASAPTAAAEDTIALARLLLADEATGPGWKKKYNEVGAWQGSRALKADKLFGPVTALKMAEELGTLPLVRYWPKGSKQGQAVEGYRDALEHMAAGASEPRKSQLLAASAREQGQGFSAKPGRPKTVISI